MEEIYRGEKTGSLLPIYYDGKDVYNPTIPFEYRDTKFMYARVESRDSQRDSLTVCFAQDGYGIWKPVEGAPTFDMQDPFIDIIHGQWVLGGVKVNWEQGCSWHTDFYMGENPFELSKFAEGPKGMKDIRLGERRNGNIGIFTRPQGEQYKLGKIGFTSVGDLSDINATVLANAPLTRDHFGDSVWGGVNQAKELPNEDFGVIYHRAWLIPETPEYKEYEAWSLEYNPVTNECSDMRRIAECGNFPEVQSKYQGVTDKVVFPVGIVTDEVTTLFVGLRDTGIGTMIIPYPFSC